MSSDKTYFELGSISRTYSFKGEVILYIDADDPSKYYQLNHILIHLNEQYIPFFIEKASIHKRNQLKLKIEGFNSDNEAQTLLKKKVFLSTDLLPKLGDQQFYYHEIENFIVYDADIKEKIGQITNVIDHPGNTLLEINANEVEILIPLNDKTFHQIDKVNKKIFLFIPEGLIELYTENE